MRTLIRHFTIIAGITLAMGAAHAQGLPDDVASAYQDYQTALDAGDAVALLEAASRAHEAGERARIDEGTLAVLAENHGFAASANGDLETAQDAWRESARLSDRAEVDPVDRAWRWHNAALIALRNSDASDAYACSRNAVRALDDLEGDFSSASDFAGDAYLTRALTAMGRGQIADAGMAATEAVNLFEASLTEPDTRYGLAQLYAGVAQTLDQDFERATYSLHMAQDVLSDVDPDHANASTLRAAYTSARLNLYHADDAETDAAFARLNARLDQNPFHAERYTAADELASSVVGEPEPDRPCCDAEPLTRREPRYPYEAAVSDLDGVVYVRFDVTADGRTENVEVIGSFPPGIFDDASVEAVRRWRYQPATRDGEPVPHQGLETRFDYRMNE
ncbi:energy transducer TonB [Maricaulis parjimensis]|uniref:energy transducer TonB n=1 Tax=Maricaulis parjimensis TaxID=144023 RepID=UPI00193950DD|nr:energy transducer TonB [Maricaulis parjimensis]